MDHIDKMESKKRDFFEDKIKPLLIYAGTLGAIIMTIAYIVLIIVLIFGFKAGAELKQVLTFAIINAIVGLLVMFFLKIQGRDLAKNRADNKQIVNLYYSTETKDKPIRSMKYFWIKSTVLDVIFKGLTVIATTTLMIRIIISGNNDLALLGLAFVNILMFICFGFLALVKAYDFFNEFQIPYIKKQLKEQGIELNKTEKDDIISKGEIK